MGERRGWLGRRLHSLTADERELEAEALQDQVQATGAQPVGTCAERDDVCVAGSIQSVTLGSRDGAPLLSAELYDGTGTVNLVFLGRRRIPGIEAGRCVVVHGRLMRQEQRPTIFNPRYELLPSGSATA